jgi:hypothetical protein
MQVIVVSYQHVQSQSRLKLGGGVDVGSFWAVDERVGALG